MKKLFLMCALFAFSHLHCQEITKIIIVRHGEKALDDPKDPSLSEQGKQRALRLAELLKEEKIDLAFATPFKRTIHTITPLCEVHKVTITNYDARQPQEFKSVIQNNKGKTILIAGHSNTIPNLVNMLIGEDKFPEIDESDFGKLFILHILEEKVVGLTLLNY